MRCISGGEALVPLRLCTSTHEALITVLALWLGLRSGCSLQLWAAGAATLGNRLFKGREPGCVLQLQGKLAFISLPHCTQGPRSSIHVIAP